MSGQQPRNSTGSSTRSGGTVSRRPARRRKPATTTRRQLMLGLGATLASLTIVAPAAVRPVEAASACSSTPERPASRALAPPAVAANLSAPFTYRPDQAEQAAALAEARSVVTRQAGELGIEACYREKPAEIASRVDFLSPFEFLVYSIFDTDPQKRDALLDQYATDPQSAIKGLGEAFPSTRAQATLTSYAYYDVNSDRIRINAAQVPISELRRVLVHEFWHAMPKSRSWAEPDGRTLRATGFWLQEQRAGRRVWLPVDERRGLPYATYLLDEAMATTMETRYAGPPKHMRPELAEVQAYLDKLMAVANHETVLHAYLGSQPDQLAALTDAHRAHFPELEAAARP